MSEHRVWYDTESHLLMCLLARVRAYLAHNFAFFLFIFFFTSLLLFLFFRPNSPPWFSFFSSFLFLARLYTLGLVVSWNIKTHPQPPSLPHMLLPPLILFFCPIPHFLHTLIREFFFFFDIRTGLTIHLFPSEAEEKKENVWEMCKNTHFLLLERTAYFFVLILLCFHFIWGEGKEA